LGSSDLAVLHSVQVQGFVEVLFRKAELIAVSAQYPSVGEHPRLVQAVTRTPKQRESSPAFVEGLVEVTCPDVNKGTLQEDLPAQTARCLLASEVKLGKCGLGVPALQQHEHQTEASFGRACS
jgi:hypothetical protein